MSTIQEIEKQIEDNQDYDFGFSSFITNFNVIDIAVGTVFGFLR